MNIKKSFAAIVTAVTIASGGFPLPIDGQALAQTMEAHTHAAQQVINAGKKYLGTPYQFSSSRENSRTFDCSDFTRQAFLDGTNIEIPSNSRSQADYVERVGKTSTNWENLKPGDLMFFVSYKGPKASSYSRMKNSKKRITHVGIYLGDGKMLHTYSKESGGVRIDKIEGTHWEYRFVFGGSAIK